MLTLHCVTAQLLPYVNIALRSGHSCCPMLTLHCVAATAGWATRLQRVNLDGGVQEDNQFSFRRKSFVSRQPQSARSAVKSLVCVFGDGQLLSPDSGSLQAEIGRKMWVSVFWVTVLFPVQAMVCNDISDSALK